MQRGALPLLSVVAMLATGGAACGAGSVGHAVRPSDPKASEALGEGKCSTVKSGGEPLVVDLAAHERADLEEAMGSGIAVVAWSCTSLALLRDCHAKGTYAFHGLSPQEFTVKLDDADEIKANLPTFGAALALKLETDMSRGATLDLAVSMIGKQRTTVAELTAADLEGKCDGATHFVRGAYLGAFAMGTGTHGSARAALEIFKAGVSGDSSSAKLSEARDGDVDACHAFDPAGTTPPARCRSLLRLELTPITQPAVAAADGKQGAPKMASGGDACPEGLVLVDRKCAVAADRPFLCRGDRPIECNEQCDKGHARSCAVLGTLYARGAGVPKDMAQAASFFGKACDKGEPLGCANLGVLTDRGDVGAADPVRASALYTKACDGGEPSGCYDLGLLYDLGRGAGVDVKRAASLYAKGCDGGEPAACSNLGLLTEEGKAPGTLDDARTLYQRACDGDSGIGCVNLALVAKKSEGFPPATIVGFLEKACAAGRADGCDVAGGYYERGEGVAKDPAKARERFQKACDAGLGLGCTDLAGSLEDAHDDAGAIKAYERGCHAAGSAACVNYGAMLEEGRGTAKDPAKAATLYGDACDAKIVEGCVNLATMLEAGAGVPKDEKRAREAYKKACALGQKDACAREKR